MLIRLGEIFSRIFLASGGVLLFWAFVVFVRTGIWHPFSLAEALAFYRVTVPDFGLAGLKTIYSLAGSVWLLAYFILFGLMIAMASAKAAPGSTKAYLIKIISSPLTILEMTLSSLAYVVRGVLKYTFIAVTSFVVLTCLWWGLNYFTFAHKFADSPSCNLRQTMFGGVPQFDFIYACADASGVAAAEGRRFYILFMASQAHPDPTNTGHVVAPQRSDMFFRFEREAMNSRGER